jgi:hypothetical protein
LKLLDKSLKNTSKDKGFKDKVHAKAVELIIDCVTSRKNLISGVPKRRLVAFKWHTTNLAPLVVVACHGNASSKYELVACQPNTTTMASTGGVLR